jgi:hypothetical protein
MEHGSGARKWSTEVVCRRKTHGRERDWWGTFSSQILNETALINDFMSLVRFEEFIAVTMKNSVFWDVTPCDSCKDRSFGGTYHLHLQGEKLLLTLFLACSFFSS